MPLDHVDSERVASVRCDAACALADGGTLCLYTGPKPASPDVPLDTQLLLATLRLGSPAFALSIKGVARANPIELERSAPNTGRATWFRVYAADGTALWDGTYGMLDCNLNGPTDLIQKGVEVAVTRYSRAEPAR